MLSVFNWLRLQVKNAFVAGIQDGMAEIGDPDADAGGALAMLRAKAAIAAKPADAAVPPTDVEEVESGLPSTPTKNRSSGSGRAK